MNSGPTGRPPSTGQPTAGGPPGRPRSEPLPEPSIIPSDGWHCGHYFYRFRRDRIDHAISEDSQRQFREALSLEFDDAPQRLAAYWISGHRADFGVMVMDPNPGKVDAVHQKIMAPGMGRYIEPAWSFVSMTEISEYVPTLERFRDRLIAGGADPDSPELAAKVGAYERRLPMMNEQRLRPEFPTWPSACFYPMNKSRVVGANWFTEPFSRRNSLTVSYTHLTLPTKA